MLCREGSPAPPFIGGRAGGQGEEFLPNSALGGAPAKGRNPPPTRPPPLLLFLLFPKTGSLTENWQFDFFNLGFELTLYFGQREHLVHDAIIPTCNDTFMYPFPSGVPDIPGPSRMFPMKTPEPFPNSETGLSLYESYSPDHSGSPRDIPDPIRDSEQHSVSFS